MLLIAFDALAFLHFFVYPYFINHSLFVVSLATALQKLYGLLWDICYDLLHPQTQTQT